MQKLYTDLIGMSVITEYSSLPVALVRDVIIDPENGKLLAFVVNKDNIIVPIDIIGINNGLIISDKDHILPISDVLRVQEVSKMKINIIGASVVTERAKMNLGRVVDYEIDAKHMVLTKIHVAKTFFFFRFQERIIYQRQIVKIGKEIIIVKDSNECVVKEKARVRPEAFAA